MQTSKSSRNLPKTLVSLRAREQPTASFTVDMDAALPLCIQKHIEREDFRWRSVDYEHREDVEKATRLPGAVTSDLTRFPRGGRRVTIPAPGGSHIHVIYGQEERTPDVKAS